MSDTIAALATARGVGGIAILRVSGDHAGEVLCAAFRPARAGGAFVSHRLMYGHAVDAAGQALDEVMAVLMQAPHTYTREDVAEIHCHGGYISAENVLKRLIECGARIAEPGEFTKRAFLNGRIDLSRAEAVMQLIGANSEAAARASVRQLQGGVSGFVNALSGQLTDMLALIEASTDFPDEVEEEAAAAQILQGAEAMIGEIDYRCDARNARILREGASIVLSGRPNVGKSSLLNALLNQERAIVTDIPGTTRDVLTERIVIGGVVAEISDTAGRRDTHDPIEKIGVDRARRAVETADIVLLVLDASEKLTQEDIALLHDANDRTLICLNKTDLKPVTDMEQIRAIRQDLPALEISAGQGTNLTALLECLSERLNVGDEAEGKLTVERHLKQARAAQAHLQGACEALRGSYPLDTVAIDLRAALEALAQITGADATEQLISNIFANFCVGK